KQILINLLTNAVKFTPRGDNVTVRAYRDSGRLAMSVSDTDISIAESDLARVMEPFGQADSSLQRRYESTSLRLPLVRSFVELHGATFSLKSEVGVGTTATVVFPAERTMAKPAAGDTVTTLRSVS